MRVVDDAILAALADCGVDIHDSYVPADDNTGDDNPRVITTRTPYAAFYSSPGYDAQKRLTGRSTWASVYFSLTHVGVDRVQVKAAVDRTRARLLGKRLTVPGHRVNPCELESSTRVFRDDDAIHADGSPLFYSVDEYVIRLTNRVTA